MSYTVHVCIRDFSALERKDSYTDNILALLVCHHGEHALLAQEDLSDETQDCVEDNLVVTNARISPHSIFWHHLISRYGHRAQDEQDKARHASSPG